MNHPLLELCLTSTKGLGLFAKSDIKRGTRILSETPLVTVPCKDLSSPHELWGELENLTPAQLDVVHGLERNKELSDRGMRRGIRIAATALKGFRARHRQHALDAFVEMQVKILTTIKTNATSLSPEKGFGIFPLFSRVNHSCTPNIHASYNPSLGAHTVHAIRDIQPGEEILASYIDCIQPISERNKDLETYGVDCYCTVCKSSSAAIASEKRRDRLHDIVRGLKAYNGQDSGPEPVPIRLIPKNPASALQVADTAISLLQEEGLTGMPLATAYRQASKYSLQQGLVEKAKSYAAKEAEVERCCLGTETVYLNDGEGGGDGRVGGGDAESWAKWIDHMAEKDAVKIRMCEKREAKERKRVEKKADKKAAKKGGKR